MTLKWGILATGAIARTFARAITGSTTAELVAVASRDQERANGFAAEFPGAAAHGSYQALLDDPQVQAVYVATPHPEHAQWAIRALEAGRHVLCEKPMGLNHPEVMAMVDAAGQSGRFLMEAFMYRCHPQTGKLIELLRDGAIGRIVHLDASFGFSTAVDPASRLFAPARGGGAILDVGCYPVSAARLLLGGEPVRVSAQGHLGSTGVDEWASAALLFEDDVSAHLSTAVTCWLDNAIRIYGTGGRIQVPNPWLCADADGNWSFQLLRNGQEPETVSGVSPPLYRIEADHVGACIDTGNLESPHMSWSDSRGNALVLDEWRNQIGEIYPQERPETHRGPVSGRLRRATDSGRLRRATVAAPGAMRHLSKPVSRLVMGCDNQPSISHAAVMWDSYLELGGNCFDTAYIYGGGAMETLLGHWHTARGVRDDIVIVGKGAHTPDDRPEFVAPQLEVSLTRLQTDCVDVYFLHRDNPEVPVGEFVEAVNAEIRRGRIRAWGGSNWTLERVRAANDYAEANALQGMSAVSNNFSLARMIRPLWPGVQTATDAAFRDYLAATGTALLPWSSQARGFFTPWAEAVRTETGRGQLQITRVEPTARELIDTWFSEDNFERRRRALELAREKGVEPIQIALAYVICQPFPCFPLIGPRQIGEIRSSLAAIDIQLSPAECAWLDLAG